MYDVRPSIHSLLSNILTIPESVLPKLMDSEITKKCQWDVSFPINTLIGPEEITEKLILPLRQSISHIRRRDEIFIGGNNRRQQGGYWIASICHYVGNFKNDLLGIKANDKLVFLRAGEFYRIEDCKISEAKIILDFLDLMRQTNNFPLPQMLGTEMLFPGPATHDGVIPEGQSNGENTLDIVESMLADLHKFDPNDFSSKGQTGPDGYWHEDMLWYGPGGIGSNYRWEGFEKDHRRSFLTAFPDRKGGDHYCRIGDGNYAAISGWPSMTMTHLGDYLEIPATGKKLTLRVMDFYRCADNKIMENWVLLDYLDLFNQMGVNLIENSK